MSNEFDEFKEVSIDDFAKEIEKLYTMGLCDVDETLDPHAEQYCLLALEHISMARRYMALALMHQASAIAANGRKS